MIEVVDLLLELENKYQIESGTYKSIDEIFELKTKIKLRELGNLTTSRIMDYLDDIFDEDPNDQLAILILRLSVFYNRYTDEYLTESYLIDLYRGKINNETIQTLISIVM